MAQNIFFSLTTDLDILLLFRYLTPMHRSGWPWLVRASYREPSFLLHLPASPLPKSLSSTSPSTGHLVH